MSNEKQTFCHTKKFEAEFTALGKKEYAFLSFLNEKPIKTVNIKEKKENSKIIELVTYNGGITLRQFTNSTLFDAALLAAQLVKLISQLHACDMTHGDLKPENILVDRGVLTLIDFETSSYLGNFFNFDRKFTLGYSDYFTGSLSFEELKSRDLFSLGLTIYFIATGTDLAQFPFSKEEVLLRAQDAYLDDRFKFVFSALTSKTPRVNLSDLEKVLSSPVYTFKFRFSAPKFAVRHEWAKFDFTFCKSSNTKKLNNSPSGKLVLQPPKEFRVTTSVEEVAKSHFKPTVDFYLSVLDKNGRKVNSLILLNKIEEVEVVKFFDSSMAIVIDYSELADSHIVIDFGSAAGRIVSDRIDIRIETLIYLFKQTKGRFLFEDEIVKTEIKAELIIK